VRDPVSREAKADEQPVDSVERVRQRGLVVLFVTVAEMVVDDADPPKRLPDRSERADRVIPADGPHSLERAVHRLNGPLERHNLEARNVIHYRDGRAGQTTSWNVRCLPGRAPTSLATCLAAGGVGTRSSAMLAKWHSAINSSRVAASPVLPIAWRP